MEATPSTSADSSQNVTSIEDNDKKKRSNNNRQRNNNKGKEANKSRPDTAEVPKDNKSDKNTKNQNEPKEKKPLKGFKKTDKDADVEDPDREICFICTRSIDYYAVAPCNHRTCHMCTLRLRILYKTKNCAYCKAEAQKVIFTSDGEKSYESYNHRGDTPFQDKKHGIRFETEKMYNETQVILQYNCPEADCEEAFENSSELKQHAKQAHNSLFCDSCLRNKKIFTHEHTLYTKPQLQKHHREGDASFNKNDETGFTGHPECSFCNVRFYNTDELYTHCRDKHEQCHLCIRNGKQHQYYKNYDTLAVHFKKEHYPCIFKECLDDKFVVFNSEIDLKDHEISKHSNSLTHQQRSEARRVGVNLNYSSSNQRQSQGSNSSRQQRNPVTLSAEDFPDINGSVNPSTLLTTQLSNVNLSLEEQWPTLGEENNSGKLLTAVSINESDASVVSRQAAALDRIADIFKNLDKVLKFRQLTAEFTSLKTDAESYIDSVYNDLCNKDVEMSAKVLTGAKDLVNNKSLKSEIIRAWNQKKNPSLKAEPRVLEVDPTNRQGSSNKKNGVWDKVASAAINAGGAQSFPLLSQHSKTPWGGSSTPRVASEDDLQELFPSLPAASSYQSRRADINNMIRRDNVNAWAGGSSQANPTDSDHSDSMNDTNNTNRKKKGKKGKQVLFRVGL